MYEKAEGLVDEEDPPRTVPMHNIILSFGDLDANSKSIFTDLYSGLVVKFMDKKCERETQEEILWTYMQILSKGEGHNVYYGLLIDFESRTFYKYNRDEGVIYESEVLEMDLEEIYLGHHWCEEEEKFYRLLAGMCLRLLRETEKLNEKSDSKESKI